MENQNKFMQTEKAIQLQDINEIEKKFGFMFPEEVKKHYLQYNGGCPQKYIYKTKDAVLVINEFLPIKYGNAKGLLEYYYKELALIEKVIPENLIPFAVDPGGDIFCISLSENDYGSIYMWRHEKYDNSDEVLLYVCSSFEDFINGMEEDA